jgi:hypothetical protein
VRSRISRWRLIRAARQRPVRATALAAGGLLFMYVFLSVAALGVGSLAAARCGITPPNLPEKAEAPVGTAPGGQLLPPALVCRWTTADGQTGEWRIGVACLLSDAWCPRRNRKGNV